MEILKCVGEGWGREGEGEWADTSLGGRPLVRGWKLTPTLTVSHHLFTGFFFFFLLKKKSVSWFSFISEVEI